VLLTRNACCGENDVVMATILTLAININLILDWCYFQTSRLLMMTCGKDYHRTYLTLG
jgi:hypothetical protein